MSRHHVRLQDGKIPPIVKPKRSSAFKREFLAEGLGHRLQNTFLTSSLWIQSESVLEISSRIMKLN